MPTSAEIASRRGAATRARRRVVEQMREALRTIEYAADSMVGVEDTHELDRQVSILRSAAERLDLEAL